MRRHYYRQEYDIFCSQKHSLIQKLKFSQFFVETMEKILCTLSGTFDIYQLKKNNKKRKYLTVLAQKGSFAFFFSFFHKNQLNQHKT